MNNLKTQEKGEVAQLKIELRAVEKGILISKPSRHESRYDCILDDGQRLLRAQIKYANGKDKRSNGNIIVPLRKTHKNHTLRYLSSEIDVVLVYLPSVDKILVLQKEQFHNKPSFYIRTERPLNNQKRYNWYEDFIW